MEMAYKNRQLQVNGNYPFGAALRSRIKATNALKVIHDAMEGKPVTRIQLDAARIALNKCLPDLQAVAIDVNDNRPTSIDDLNARFLMAGMKPDQVWQLLENKGNVIDATAEKTNSETILDDPPTPANET